MNFVTSWTIGIFVGILIVSLILYQRSQNKPRRYQKVTLTGQAESILAALDHLQQFTQEHYGIYDFGISRTIVIVKLGDSDSGQCSIDFQVEVGSLGEFAKQLQHLLDKKVEFTIQYQIS